ncbi:sensor histidine kinase [Vibrio fluvialis]|uniref:sensor histidine kinase n=1 Tax=Vibrio fluvialis TaxID=676 RepID=UPI00192B0834|nr:ATP-binding protein [Vibrio fluvialis]MBL4281472.1 two-component sensor histidine kinase [Vibrio fluvialis]
MDGLQKWLNRSVKARLSFWMSLIIIVMSVFSAGLSFTFSFYEAHQLQDDQLRQFGALINHQGLVSASQPFDLKLSEIDKDARIFLRVLNEEHAGSDSAFGPHMTEGFSTLRDKGRTWRVYVLKTDAGQKISLAQDIDLRNEFAREGALYSLLPTLFLMPILLILTNLLINRIFLPVSASANKINRLSTEQPCVIDLDSVPLEIKPFVMSINALLARLYQSMEQQKRFIANAAHELRTPLTALSLQAESLGSQQSTPAQQRKISRLQDGLNRARNLLEQLLTHARMQENGRESEQPCSVQETLRSVLADTIVYAQRKGVDVGLTSSADATLRLAPIDLYTLLKNLVDNAIRYTPAQGTVDISVHQRDYYVEVRVSDSGPGIPQQALSQVFEPFYRGDNHSEPGSGLGLSIVSTILKRLKGKIVLRNKVHQQQVTGLEASVFLPTHQHFHRRDNG